MPALTKARSAARGPVPAICARRSVVRALATVVGLVALLALACAPVAASYAALGALARAVAVATGADLSRALAPHAPTEASAATPSPPARGALAVDRDLRRASDPPARTVALDAHALRLARLEAVATGARVPNEANARAYTPRQTRARLMVFHI